MRFELFATHVWSTEVKIQIDRKELAYNDFEALIAEKAKTALVV